MGNYANNRERLISQTKEYYDKLLTGNTVSKKQIIALSRQFKALKEEDALFNNLSNRTKSLVNKAKWVNQKDELNNFKENYTEFLKLALEGK